MITATTTKFALVDHEFSYPPANLRGFTFASSEVGYLAGVLAGKMTASNVVGAVAGMSIPPVDLFVTGYRNGVLCSNPYITASVLITYANTFIDPNLGAQIAQQQIAHRADVIFNIAGPTGNGAILTATQSGQWAIGVDADQYLSVFGNGSVPGSNKLLSTVVAAAGPRGPGSGALAQLALLLHEVDEHVVAEGVVRGEERPGRRSSSRSSR